jgi:cytoskeletal protein CcmA (bactofilin family)
MRWAGAIGLLAVACATSFYIARTAQYAECSSTRAVTYSDDLNPSLLEQADTFLNCEQRVIDSNSDQALELFALVAVVALLFGINSLFKTSGSIGQNIGSAREMKSNNRLPIFAESPKERTNMVNPPSIIGPSVQMRGALRSIGDFHIEGSIEGDIQCSSLVIAESGQVQGDIFADRVMIRGRFSGALHANEVVLSAGSHVEGIIIQKSLQVEAGARFNGDCRHSENPHVRHEGDTAVKLTAQNKPEMASIERAD